jgi:hypothetical protein
MTSTISSVNNAAGVRRCFSLGSSRRYQGANNNAMIAAHRMVPKNGSRIQPSATDTATSSNSSTRLSR